MNTMREMDRTEMARVQGGAGQFWTIVAAFIATALQNSFQSLRDYANSGNWF